MSATRAVKRPCNTQETKDCSEQMLIVPLLRNTTKCPGGQKVREPNAVSSPKGKRMMKDDRAKARGSQKALGLVPARLKGLERHRCLLSAATPQGRGCLCLAAVKTSEHPAKSKGRSQEPRANGAMNMRFRFYLFTSVATEHCDFRCIFEQTK